jgi:hypothetical protein
MTGVYTVRKRKEEVMNVVAEAGSIYIVHPQAVKPNPSHRPHELYKSGNTLVAIRSSREEKKKLKERGNTHPLSGSKNFPRPDPTTHQSLKVSFKGSSGGKRRKVSL